MTAFNSNEVSPQTVQARKDRLRLQYEYVHPVAFVVDFVIIVLASIVTGTVYHIVVFDKYDDLFQYAGIGFITALIFVLVTHARGLYQSQELINANRQIRHIVGLWTITFFFLTAVAFSLKLADVYSRGSAAAFFLVGFTALATGRFAWQYALRAALEQGLFVRRRILAICEEGAPSALACIAELQRYGHTPVSTLTVAGTAIDEDGLQSLVKQAAAVARNFHVDEIVVSMSLNRLALVGQIVEGLRALPLPVRFAVDATTAELILRPAQRLGRTFAFQVQRHPLSFSERVIKRTLDITVALTALIVLSPSMLITAIAIKIDTPGPILFRQLRYGVNGKRFRILKFRSMSVMEDGAHVQQARRGDARVTKVGRIIRERSIDELPQLLNVLRGEMSIVGPRPHAVAHDDQYEELILRYAMRRFLKPGLTGWAQVNGSRGETPTLESMMTRLHYDLWYIDNWSLWLEITIIFRTFISVLNPKDVY
ncbi:undecaprenyl-phosphate glucose phosphotransferase [Bosea sp. PAMC 26642]|uniref:undecaprenyl-phosphate glucose phosphotransferase n=1 Tax=Bosea sp. (strain PAMC 26642) TaxID=1792307 RepID=UPI0009E79E08|nr:undecaprenyl-phosphate glucose phosphotransferase [Bosea sp. PAMC 26642]